MCTLCTGGPLPVPATWNTGTGTQWLEVFPPGVAACCCLEHALLSITDTGKDQNCKSGRDPGQRAGSHETQGPVVGREGAGE